jgi:hypothetical protein
MLERVRTADLPYSAAEAGECRMLNELEEAYRSDADDRMMASLVDADEYSAGRRAETQAEAADALAAADVFLWKARYGRFPDTLAEAMSPVPLDPFDLRPLRYQRERSGFVVYGVGKTLLHAGGPDQPISYLDPVLRYPDSPD